MAKRVNTRFVSIVGVVLVGGATAVLVEPFVKNHLFAPPVAKQVAALRSEARKDVKEGRFTDAREAINRAVRLDPSNKELSVERGDILALMTQEDGPVAMEEARRAWENALASDPNYKVALLRLLNSYIDQLEVRPSPDACLRLRDAATRELQADPKDVRAKAYLQIATIQQWVQGMPTSADQYNGAIAKLAELQKQDPSSGDVLFYLLRGKTFKAGEDFRSAHVDEANAAIADCRSLLEQSAAKFPDDAGLSFRIFQGYVMLMDVGRDQEQVKKDHRSADTALLRARKGVKEQDPRYADFQYVASDWARRNGHIDESEKILRDLYTQRKTDQRARLALCRVLALTGDPAKRDEAIDILRQPIQNSGESGVKVVGAKELEAQTLLDLTSLRVAQYPSVDPAKRPALMTEIDTAYKTIVSMAVADAIPVLRLKGLIAQLKGENVEAVGALSRAMTLLEHSDPNNPIKYDLMYQLATVDRLAQQNRAAEKLLTTIVERFEGYTPARLQLADIYLEENNLQEAARHIEVLARQKPGSPDVTRLQIVLAQRSDKLQDASKLAAALPESRFDEKMAKAQVAANLQDYPTAIRLLADMRQEHPDDTGITVALYQACVKAGPSQRENGRKILADALKQHPTDPRLQLLQKQADDASPEEIEKLMDELAARSGDQFYVKIRDARKAMGQGNLSDALARTLEADKIRHNDPATWDLYFNIYTQQQNWDMAQRAVENLARLNADQAGGRMYRWKLAMARGNYGEAITTARDLTTVRENFGQSWILLAQAFQANGQFNEALDKYQAALERQTTNIDAYKGIADCYDALSQPDRAYETVSQARRLFPDSVYLRERSLNYLATVNPVAVVPEREKLLAQNPADPENYLALAAACVQAAQRVFPVDPARANAYTVQARDVLTKGVGKFPDHLRLNGALADAMQNSRQFEAGVSILQDLAKLPAWKGKPEPSLLLGEYYARSGGPDAAKNAEKAFREAWEKTGNKSIEIELRIVALLEDQKRFDDALAVLAANANDSRIARQTLQVHIAANHTDAARRGLNEALAKTPNDVNLLNLLAVVDIDGGQYGEARQTIAKALGIDPRNDISLYYQALTELRDGATGDLGIALRNLAGVVNRNPRNVQFRIERANALLRIHDSDGAASDLEEALRYEPYNRDARLRLLDLYTQAKKWQSFEQVVTFAELNPVLSSGIWFRAHAYALAAQERYKDAIAKIREAIAIEPNNPIYARDYLIVLLQSKDNSGVVRETERLVAAGHREWWVFHLRGLARFAAGSKADALDQFDKAMAAANEAKDTDAYQQILTSMADVSIDEALKRVDARIDQDPRWRLQSISLRMRKGEWATALGELQPLLKVRTQLPREQRLAVLRFAAECYQSGGQPAASKSFYMEWLGESPNDTTALNNFACLLAEDLHDPSAAKKYSLQAYDAGRKLNFIDPLIVDTHGWVLTLCGGQDANQGLTILTNLVAGNSDFLEARYHLALAYLGRNRPADAVTELQAALDQIKAMEAKGKSVRPQFKASVEATMQKAQQASASTR